jgi:hypothetical protein
MQFAGLDLGTIGPDFLASVDSPTDIFRFIAPKNVATIALNIYHFFGILLTYNHVICINYIILLGCLSEYLRV